LALKDGGRVLCGGGRPKDLAAPFDQGAFFEPTLLADLSPEHPCSREEIFGPVATLHRFKSEAEVVAYANNTSYGLAGSLWTNNIGRANRIAKQWQTGMIWVNTWLHRDLRVPFGTKTHIRVYRRR
jgi:aminomuconate-semialdehyde/2-hydroxymuconate-6-semialdehyde dehydrogenase